MIRLNCIGGEYSKTYTYLVFDYNDNLEVRRNVSHTRTYFFSKR